MHPISNTKRLTVKPPWRLELKPWPFWNQLNDPMPAGIPNTNDANDCGPECVAMCLRYLTGVMLQADYVKDVIYGEGYVGYTQVPDLEAYLENWAETPARTILTTSASNQLWWEWDYLRKGKPLIGLFYGYADNAGQLQGGHFRAVMGLDRHYVYTADPWTGQRRVEGHNEHWTWSKGLLIGIDRTRSIKP